jgi:hypothetical protein
MPVHGSKLTARIHNDNQVQRLFAEIQVRAMRKIGELAPGARESATCRQAARMRWSA